MRGRLVRFVIAVGIAVAVCPLALGQGEPWPILTRRLHTAGEPVPRIVNGLRAGGEYPTVGMLARNGLFQCSGTLIGCRTFLTAGHCVSAPFVPSQYSVFLQHQGFVGVSSIARHPDFAFGVRSDVSVVMLSSPVTAISASKINTVGEPPLGTVGDLAGFGSVGETFGPGTSSYFAGIKRRGAVVTAACTGVPESSHVCWNFSAPIGPPGADSNSCKGDSGGPLFADVPGLGVAVVGVTSGGNDSCLPEDNAFDADVHFDHEWIESVAGAELGSPSCGPVAPVLEPGSQVHYDRFAMEMSDAGVAYSIVVPAGSSRLRVTSNGELIPFQDYDLYVKHGGQPSITPPDYDCASKRGTSFEACAFDFPLAGEWGILVSNPGFGEGEYDLTVSILGPASPGPCTPFDVDGNGSLSPLSDGVLAVRRLFGISGAALTAGALAPDAWRDEPAIDAFFDGCGTALDVDGNGSTDALSDGILFLRYLFGLSGEALVVGAVGAGCSRCDVAAIESYLATLTD
jgi:hypothetical protein